MTTQDIQVTLERAGLTPNEAKTYMALVDLGSSLAGMLAKKADLHRRPTYDALNRLVEKGLAGYTIKSGKKYFQAADPEKLIEISKEKEKALESVMPDIKERFATTRPEIFAETYEGKEGLKTVMDYIIKEKKDWLSIGSSGKGPKALPYFVQQWHKKREKNRIYYKVLVANTEEGRKNAENYSKMRYLEYKFLPKEIQNPQTIWIFGNKVAIILVSEEHPITFLIDSKEIASSFRAYFDWLWQKSK